MRILAVTTLTPHATPNAIRSLLPAETEHIKRLFEQGVIVEGYIDTQSSQVYLMLEFPNVAEAEAILSTLPLVQAGLITFTYAPLVGLPAIAQSLQERNLSRPAWWPSEL